MYSGELGSGRVKLTRVLYAPKQEKLIHKTILLKSLVNTQYKLLFNVIKLRRIHGSLNPDGGLIRVNVDRSQ